MDTFQILEVLETDPVVRRYKHFVVPSDSLPQTRDQCCIVYNFSPTGTAGTHWGGIFKGRESIHLFDSLSLDLSVAPDVYRWLLQQQLPVYYNQNQVQSFKTSSCGFYAILFLCFMARGVHYECFLNMFTPYLELNDYIVENVMQGIFGIEFNTLKLLNSKSTVSFAY